MSNWGILKQKTHLISDANDDRMGGKEYACAMRCGIMNMTDDFK